mmetsp:Transcript_546/g.1398  ORF Transcript_546/g.1398 Transcript_546/m.1398 type:complete len:247 (+) Transcript_546:165-905(+)
MFLSSGGAHGNLGGRFERRGGGGRLIRGLSLARVGRLAVAFELLLELLAVLLPLGHAVRRGRCRRPGRAHVRRAAARRARHGWALAHVRVLLDAIRVELAAALFARDAVVLAVAVVGALGSAGRLGLLQALQGLLERNGLLQRGLEHRAQALDFLLGAHAARGVLNKLLVRLRLERLKLGLERGHHLRLRRHALGRCSGAHAGCVPLPGRAAARSLNKQASSAAGASLCWSAWLPASPRLATPRSR